MTARDTISPLKSDWTPQPQAMAEAPYDLKEVLGGRALFRHHCGMRMHKVFVYRREPDGRIGSYGLRPNSWICLVCNARDYNEDWFDPAVKA